ncbi:MAG: VOC family protein [Lachnospiraceae bacterium]|nr:VOC family protein [Lachnospiraceae bacterium]
MPEKIKGIHHVSMKCSNPEEFAKAVHFYKDLLGLELVRAWGEGDRAGAMLRAGDDIIELFASGRAGEGFGDINHFAFDVDDVDACIRLIRDNGYAVTQEPKDVTLPSDPPLPIRCAFAAGPLGESIEFFHVY